MAGRFISFHLLLASRRSRATSIHRLIISPIPCHVMAHNPKKYSVPLDALEAASSATFFLSKNKDTNNIFNDFICGFYRSNPLISKIRII
jgi:hypothetical protein